MPYLGEIAALGVSVTWAACFAIFIIPSKRIGSFSMSHYRMIFAVIFLLAAQFISTGTIFSQQLALQNWLLLIASGLLGFFLCDALLLQGNVDLGARFGTLLFSFYPFISALLAKLFLGETMMKLGWLGMSITLLGIFFVLFEKGEGGNHTQKEHFARGLLLLVGAVCFQALSFIFAKPAMISENGADPLTATLIRAIAGGAGYWLVSIFRGRVPDILSKARDKRALALTAAGTTFGVSGVWLSMVAIKYAPIGIASTLMSLVPVAILPMTGIAHKEKISLRAIMGAIIVCLGVAILFLA